MKDFHIEKAKKIRCVICDIDGVLTDGSLYLNSLGNELKAFHVHDGLGLKLLMCAGIEVAVITGSVNVVVENRMAQLGIKHFFTGQINKQAAYQALKERLNLIDAEFAYIGDDLPDLPIMQQVGFSFAVANAMPEVKAHSDWNTELHGGRGAVREVCDFILRAQDKKDAALKRFLSQ